MSGWSVHTGRAVCLPLDDVDTDQLIPARFMSRTRAEGYGECLLHDLRRNADGAPDPAFPLERHPEASVLITGHNFGCGSSREAAVYALVDAGIRVVIAPGFGDIFAANAVNNGLLPARVDEDARAILLDAVGGGAVDATVSLERATVSVGSVSVAFALDDAWRTRLINGWDDIDLTLAHAARIACFRERRARETRWAWPAAESPAKSRPGSRPDGRTDGSGEDRHEDRTRRGPSVRRTDTHDGRRVASDRRRGSPDASLTPRRRR